MLREIQLLNAPSGPWRWLRAWGPPVCLMVLIVLLSSIQGSPRPSMFNFPHQDKVIHATVYANLGALWMRALWLSHPRLAHPRTVLVAVLVVSGFGAFDEFYQGSVPYRSPDLLDWVADCSGGLLGAVAVALWRKRRNAPTHAPSPHSPDDPNDEPPHV